MQQSGSLMQRGGAGLLKLIVAHLGEAELDMTALVRIGDTMHKAPLHLYGRSTYHWRQLS